MQRQAKVGEAVLDHRQRRTESNIGGEACLAMRDHIGARSKLGQAPQTGPDTGGGSFLEQHFVAALEEQDRDCPLRQDLPRSRRR